MLLSYNFVKELEKDKYSLDTSIKQEFLNLENDLESVEYNSFMFSYYENILQSLDQELIKNTPELIDEAIEEAWYHLHLINNEPLVHFEWLELVSLYNNLAGLYESLGETRKSKAYYNKVIKLNRLELLSA